jgi:site-specific DNA-methyltransferase (adenine-specific)
MERRLGAGSVSVIVTSPPYNIGKPYRKYSDNRTAGEYLPWMRRVARACMRVLEAGGSFFINLGGKPSAPWWPMEVASEIRSAGFVLQNDITWVKSIAISKDEVGDYPGIAGDIAVGHFKPVNSPRFVNGLSEHIFHFTKRGDVPLDKLGVGVPYQDKSNVSRWKAAAADVRDRGNVWFIPYETIHGARQHPCVFPVKLPEMCIRLHGVRKTKLVLDPFLGTGSTALAADRLGVPMVGFEIDPFYVKLAENAIESQRAARAEFLTANPSATEVPWDRISRAG